MTKTHAYSQNFAKIVATNQRQGELAFDLTQKYWPWLALPPQHPVLIEKYQYFGSITAAWAFRLFEPGTPVALTQFSWHCPKLYPRSRYGTRAVATNLSAESPGLVELDLYTDTAEHLTHMSFTGASFADRDFYTWRQQSKERILAAKPDIEIDFAPASSVGLECNGVSFVSNINDGAVLSLVGSNTGFHPHHPYHTGSGDHVNTANLIDCALQTAHLVLAAGKPMICIGGSAQLRRFIELDVPFEITLKSQSLKDGIHEVTFAFSQLGKDNSHITLRLKA